MCVESGRFIDIVVLLVIMVAFRATIAVGAGRSVHLCVRVRYFMLITNGTQTQRTHDDEYFVQSIYFTASMEVVVVPRVS
jgi:hypothetical protein